VDNEVVNSLGFLRVPTEYLKNRRIFEPLILITLADFITNGRIIVSHSMQYRNKWTDVPDIDIDDEDRDKSVSKMESELDDIWKEFTIHTQNNPEICHKGRINEKRLPSSIGGNEAAIRKAKIDAFVESLEVKDITEILWSVDEITGFLDSFKIVNKSYHGNSLPDEERKNLAMISVLARGMNIGLKGIVKSLQGKYGIGRLINFDENYVSIENLEDANRTIIRKWDALNFGKMWYVIDGLLNSYCDKEVRQSCGDTQGQLLSLWG
jgi:hypothetical protein